jgi:hypothetical protein
MNLVQFAHGLLVDAENVGRRIAKELPSFNPKPHELPANPFASTAGASTVVTPVPDPIAKPAPVIVPANTSVPATAAPVAATPTPAPAPAPVTTTTAAPVADVFATPVNAAPKA